MTPRESVSRWLARSVPMTIRFMILIVRVRSAAGVHERASAEDGWTRVKFACERCYWLPRRVRPALPALSDVFAQSYALGPELIIGLIFLDDPPENVGARSRKPLCSTARYRPFLPRRLIVSLVPLNVQARPPSRRVDALAIDFRRREVNLNSEVRVGVIASVL